MNNENNGGKKKRERMVGNNCHGTRDFFSVFPRIILRFPRHDGAFSRGFFFWDIWISRGEKFFFYYFFFFFFNRWKMKERARARWIFEFLNRDDVLNICRRFTIVTAEEWAKLMQFYDVDHTIIIKKNNTDLQTEPSKCKRSLNYLLQRSFNQIIRSGGYFK